MTDTSAEALLKLAEALDAWRGFVAEGYEVPAASTPMLQASTTLRALAAERAQPPADVVERVAKVLWSRFAPSYSIEWENETHAAEYRCAAEGALSALRLGDKVPAGVVVPREMTPEMYDKGTVEMFRCDLGDVPAREAMGRIYAAILSAIKGGEHE